MRVIERSTAFKRDYKRESKGRHGLVLAESLKPVLTALLNDLTLEASYRDHNLSGNWSGYRECHVKPDLLLIYKYSGKDVLRLARLGSHSELFG